MKANRKNRNRTTPTGVVINRNGAPIPSLRRGLVYVDERNKLIPIRRRR